MNRIIIIGNGFDLAHGLETGYRHFIDYLWKEEDNKFSPHDFSYCPDLDSGLHYKYESNNKPDEIQVTIKNVFLETISQKTYLQNL
jgi:hypothetical protein